MNGTFDIVTLLFLVIAVVIFLRLRSVLGRRTGNERPPRYDPYSAPDASGKPVRDNIVTLPRAEPARAPDELDEATFAKRLKDVAVEGSDVAKKLQVVAQVDRSFDPKHFMAGARAAYEMIVTSFAEGDRKTLKQLLARDVFDSFSTALAERERNGETVEFKFVGISSAEVIDAEVAGKTASITVKFVSDLITATRNREGAVIDGDPSQIRDVTDIWTFARDVSSRDPNWRLVATSSGA